MAALWETHVLSRPTWWEDDRHRLTQVFERGYRQLSAGSPGSSALGDVVSSAEMFPPHQASTWLSLAEALIPAPRQRSTIASAVEHAT